MKRRQAQSYYALLSALAVLPMLAAGRVEAQTIGWMDRLFTFREEQKPMVNNSSRHRQTPRAVTQPYYNPNDHVTWSQFYTRTDLMAQDGIVGSASKVMRTAPLPDELVPVQPEVVANMEAPGGYLSIGDRALQNAREGRPQNIQIGEPGQGPGMLEGDSRVGRGTQVGAPVNDWRYNAGPNLQSRPGDFDYQGGTQRAAGEVLAETAPKFTLPGTATAGSAEVRRPGDDVYLEYNGKDEVTRYRVQRGDTLGTIAAQPKIYNEAALWPLIYTANRKTIGGNPNTIKPKIDLTIPRDYTDEQAKTARSRAGRR